MANELIAGRYRPIERHAVGGMAAIWRAIDEWTGEMVAIKRLHPFLVSDPAARERLLREAAAMRALDHPSIVRPREVIDDPADPALVMEFGRGRGLDQRLAESGPLQPDEAVGVMTTVADALAVAHAAGIVHRDIKPANILVDEQGAVQLVDFGIATITAAADALTAPQTMVGTLRYSAPERLRGEEATPRTDVWALGAVLYELVTGKPAVPDGERHGQGRLESPLPPDTSDLPAGIAQVVDRAMTPDPSERYTDAAAFRDALEGSVADPDPGAATVVTSIAGALREHSSQRAPAPSSWSVVDRAAARFIAVVAIIAIVAAVALGFDALSSAGGQAEQTAPVAASAAPSAPVATSAPPTATPEGDDEGRGNGSGRGKGKGKGNGGGDD